MADNFSLVWPHKCNVTYNYGSWVRFFVGFQLWAERQAELRQASVKGSAKGELRSAYAWITVAKPGLVFLPIHEANFLLNCVQTISIT